MLILIKTIYLFFSSRTVKNTSTTINSYIHNSVKDLCVISSFLKTVVVETKPLVNYTRIESKDNSSSSQESLSDDTFSIQARY